MAEEHLNALNGEINDTNDAALFSKTLAQSKYISVKLRDALINKTLKLDGISEGLRESIPETGLEIYAEIRRLTEIEKYKEAKSLANKIEQDDGTKEGMLGHVYEKENDLINAEKYLKVACKKGSIVFALALGFVSEELNKLNQAEKYYLLAFKSGNKIAFRMLCLFYYGRAIKIEFFQENINSLNSFEFKSYNSASQSLNICIKMWCGIFENLRNDVYAFLLKNDEGKEMLITGLLVHHQIHLLDEIFDDETLGPKMRQDFPFYYYAVKLILKDNNESILSIPPEIKLTTENIKLLIVEQQQRYYPKN